MGCDGILLRRRRLPNSVAGSGQMPTGRPLPLLAMGGTPAVSLRRGPCLPTIQRKRRQVSASTDVSTGA
jgi:hypothetical protein